METTLEQVKPWPCEAECDAPQCRDKVSNALTFAGSPTPGLDTLYLCPKHTAETKDNYAPFVRDPEAWQAVAAEGRKYR